MSFHDYSVEPDFKKKFNQSYTDFDDIQIQNLLSRVLLSCLPSVNFNDKRLIDSIVKKTLVNDSEYRGMTKDIKNERAKNGRAKIVVDIHNVVINLVKTQGESTKTATFFLSRTYTYEKIFKKYAEKEKLPSELMAIIKENNCFKLLTQLFARNFLKKIISEEDIHDLQKLSSMIYMNIGFESAYSRTGLFQKYLHQLTSKYLDRTAINRIPSELMRMILSACRLHISYFDELNFTITELKCIHDKTEQDLNSAISNKRSIFFVEDIDLSHLPNKRYIKNWKIRHLGNVFPINNNYYNPSEKILEYLQNIPNNDRYLLLKATLIASGAISLDEIDSFDFNSTKESGFFSWLKN